MKTQLSLQDESDVGCVMLMKHGLLVWRKFEYHVDGPAAFIDSVDIKRNMFQPIKRVPCYISIIELLDLCCVQHILRWTRNLGQVLKLGSPWLEDGPDDGQAEAVFG